MKAKLLLATFFSVFCLLPSAFGQGLLTPPGAPAPTMKSLEEIEPRTPISSAPFTITVPGSYYLTTNLTVSSGDGIDINTNGVTVDLNGFTISSTAASATGNGILLNGAPLRNITIVNGFIQGAVTNNGSGVYNGGGFAYGINYFGNAPVNVLVSRVSVAGCLDGGIFLDIGDSTVVEGCTVRTVGSYGIAASTIKASSAIDCGSTAIYGEQVSDCQGQSTGGNSGVAATIAQNCYGYSSGSYGYGVNAETALNCYGTGGDYGVYAGTAQNCWGESNAGYGVFAFATAQNCSGNSGGNGTGVFALDVATGCYGSSFAGTGLNAQNAAFCTGYSSGMAIQATVANGCYAAYGTNLITYKYNMP